MPNVLVACEMSGRVRTAFARRGWDAWSADLLPDESDQWNEQPAGRHYQGDVLDIIGDDWDLVIAHPPCFTAGTPILTARGLVGIEQVAVGDRVLTHKGRWKPVTQVMSREAALVSDGVTTCTPDHPFYARSQVPAHFEYSPERWIPFELEAPEWVVAEKLQGQFVATPVRVDSLPFSCPVDNKAIWYVIGRWLGDGWTRNEQRYRNGKPNGHSTDVIICAAFDEADDLAARLAETGLRWVSSKQRTTYRFTVSHAGLTQWLEHEFGKYAYGKTLPAWLLGAPEKIRRTVLEGYLDADGSEQRGHLSSTTVSKNLAVGIRLLGASLGYTTSISTRKYEGKQYNIEGRTGEQRDSYTVTLRADDGRFTRLDEEHRWSKQRRPFEPEGHGTVYDIVVADDHSFIANGLVVHNCTDLSQVGARYWKEKQADGRQQAAAEFFMKMYELPPMKAYVVVENPRGIMGRLFREPDQIVEPWWFGDPYKKKTCLWHRGATHEIPPFTGGLGYLAWPYRLPLLKPDNPVEAAKVVVSGGSQANRYGSKNPDGTKLNEWEDSQGRARRHILRSLTFPGFARAMADQWGPYIEERRDLWRVKHGRTIRESTRPYLLTMP